MCQPVWQVSMKVHRIMTRLCIFYEYVIEHAEYEEILLTTRICTQQCLEGRSVRAMR